MSLITPTISWEAIVTNTTTHSTQYNYICKLNAVNINDPGYGQILVGYYIVDNIGHIFEIKEINYDSDPIAVRVEDLLQDDHSYGPYNDENSYVFGSLQQATLLAQAKLNRLDESAEDFVRSLGLDPKYLEIDYIDFSIDLTNPDYKEGRTFYDKDKNALSYYNEEEDITVNLGQELLIPIYNDTADLIPNGAIVYPTGVFEDKHTVDLADASKTEKCRLVAMATHDIPVGESGYVTRLGSVGGLNTIGMTGVVFLSATHPGEYTMTKPDDGAYIIPIGAIKEIHATEGSITVDPNISELTVEVTDTNGFPTDQTTNCTLSFNNSNRTFTITPIVAPFHYYDEGIKYEVSIADNVIIDDIEGQVLIYYDNDVLSFTSTPSDAEVSTIIRTQCLVSYGYWDKTNQELIYFGDERHGISMSPSTHSYLHFTRGAQFLYGLGLDSILADENGSLNSHAQFSVGQGMMIDEDYPTSVSNIASTVGLPIYYLDGVDGNLRLTSNSGFAIRTYDNTSATRLAYNEWTGTTWQISEVANNSLTLYHVFVINSYTSSERMISIMGQNEYLTKTSAREGANTEISNLLISLPFPEMVPIGTVIFQTGNYTNDVNSKIISTDAGEDYIDWRTSELAQGASPSNHGNLTGLTDPNDHLWAAALDGRLGDILKIDQIDEYTTSNGILLGNTLTVDQTNNRIGIDETNPNYTLDVRGTNGINSQTGFNIDTVTEPIAPTFSYSSGGSVDDGTHWYVVTYVTDIGETSAGIYAQATVTAPNNTVTLTIPISTDSRVTKRKIYRAKVGTAQYTMYLLTTINDNIQTSYIDTLADSGLTGSSGIIYFKSDTTNNFITLDNIPLIKADTKVTNFGYGCGQALTSGGRNVFMGTFAGDEATSASDSVIIGYNAGSGIMTSGSNIIIGSYAGRVITSGGHNVGLGSYSLFYSTTASGNTAVGRNSLFTTISGGYNTAIGYNAGNKATGNGNIFLGNSAGNDATLGNYNILIGYDVQKTAVDVSYELNIGDAILGDLSTGIISIPNSLKVDTINEYTSTAGVTIDSVLIKDGRVTNSTDAAPTTDPELANKKYVDDNIGISVGYYLVKNITQNNHGFDDDFIYHNGTIWAKAQADTATKCATHFAINIDTNTFKLVPVGEIDSTGMTDDASGALVSGKFYFLSQTVAGQITATKPTTDIVQSVLIANETNEASISIQEPYDINDVGGGGGSGTVTSVAAGNGLDFTTITTTGSVILGTPGDTTYNSTNAVTTTSHTHAFKTLGTDGAMLYNNNTALGATSLIWDDSVSAFSFGSNISAESRTMFTYGEYDHYGDIDELVFVNMVSYESALTSLLKIGYDYSSTGDYAAYIKTPEHPGNLLIETYGSIKLESVNSNLYLYAGTLQNIQLTSSYNYLYKETIVTYLQTNKFKPPLSSGATQPILDNYTLALWTDSDDGKVYIVYNNGTATKKIELT